MSAKWLFFVLILAFLAVVLWASDKITYEGERTIYTVRCENGSWEGLVCGGRMVAGDRYRFRASVSKREVLYWVVGSPEPSGKYSQCQVKDRGNWSCPEATGQPPTITRRMVNGRPKRDGDVDAIAFHAVPKWMWWMLDTGIHLYNKAGY